MIAVFVLGIEQFEDNGRVFQAGTMVELLAFILFGYAAIRGSKRWLWAPLAIVLFWVAVAHCDFLWKQVTH